MNGGASRERIAELESELAEVRRALRLVAAGQVDAVAREEGTTPVMLRDAQEALRRNERLMRAIFQGALDAIVLADDDGRCADANPAACALFGVPRERLLGQRILEIASAGPAVPAASRGVVETGARRGDLTFRRDDGGLLELEYSARAGVLPGLNLWVLRDVTERRGAEKRLASLLDLAPDAMLLVAKSGRIALVNRRAELLFGYAREELVGHDIDVLVPARLGERHTALREAFQASPESRETGATRELWVQRKDGTVLAVEIRLSPTLEGMTMAAVRDVTQRRQAEEVRARLAAVVEAASDAIVGGDSSWRITSWNPGAEALYGWSAREVLGRPMDLLVPDGLQGELKEIRSRVARGERIVNLETVRRRKDGSFVDVLLNMAPIRDASGAFSGSASFTHDLSSRLASEAQYRAMFHGSPFPLWIVDLATLRFVAANDAAVRAYGWSHAELARLTLRDLQADGDPQDPSAELRQASTRHRTAQGEVLDVEVTITPFAFREQRLAAVVAVDVTERRRLEGHLIQAQRLEAVGRLAGGVAHDFNNLLTVILSCAEFLLGDFSPDDPAREDVLQIQAAGRRGAALIRQLLAFSRQQMLEPRVVELGSIASSMKPMLHRLLGEDIALTTKLAPDAGKARVDPGQIEQVIMNLAVNARDAMPTGGKVTIETSAGHVDDRRARHFDVPTGPYVVLSVRDDGAGMDDATQARMFEPFFTTKDPGKGTGLGLATVLGIVKQSGGAIDVESAPGRGTTFHVYLPRAKEDVTAAVPATLPPWTRTARARTVLLVDDEADLRAVIVRTLKRHGYRVLDAGTAAEAIRLHEENPDVDVLLTDVVMPEVGGRPLAERLAAARPGMKVVFMSGYTDDSMLRHGVVREEVAFLPKPITPKALLHKLDEVLADG